MLLPVITVRSHTCSVAAPVAGENAIIFSSTQLKRHICVILGLYAALRKIARRLQWLRRIRTRDDACVFARSIAADASCCSSCDDDDDGRQSVPYNEAYQSPA